MGASIWRVGANSRRYLGRRMWRTGWEQVSGEWGRTAEDILGEGCGGLDGGKCLESGGELQKISWEKDVEDWMGASIWRVGANSRRYIGRRMWRTGWGQVSGEWGEQQKISWEKDVEDCMGASIWRVGGTAEDILGEGCGGLVGSKYLESGSNSRRSAQIYGVYSHAPIGYTVHISGTHCSIRKSIHRPPICTLYMIIMHTVISNKISTHCTCSGSQ